MFLRYLFAPGRGLSDLANENLANLVKFKLQINKCIVWGKCIKKYSFFKIWQP